MSALFYGNLDEVPSTEIDWLDDEEFEMLNVDMKQFDVILNLISNIELIQSASKIFVSFFEKPNHQSATNSNLQLIGEIKNQFLNGYIYKITNDIIWFKLSNLERLPSRSFTTKLIEKFYGLLYPKLLINNQSIYLFTQQPTYDHQFEYYTNEKTDDLKQYQQKLPIMFIRASEGLLFEYLIKNQKRVHVLKLPMILDEVEGLNRLLTDQLYNEIKNKNNYLLTSSNVFA